MPGSCGGSAAVQSTGRSAVGARTLAAVPLYHKNAMAGAIKPLLHAGGSVVILPNFEPRRFLETLSATAAPRPAACRRCSRRLLQHRDLIETLDFSALESLTLGSAPMPGGADGGDRGRVRLRVGETYGLTEGGPVMIGPPLDGRKVPFGSCGVAWPEGEIKLLDADGQEDRASGRAVGAQSRRDARLLQPARGQRGAPERRLARAPAICSIATTRASCIFNGRTDDMFNSGGENIYPNEVEDLLMPHPAVSRFRSCRWPHPVKGHVPVAMVVRKAGSAVTEDELKQFCLANGPAYAHPRRIRLVEEIPLNRARQDRPATRADRIARHFRDLVMTRTTGAHP